MSTHRDYWDDFYAGAAAREVSERPSPFARWVAGQMEAPSRLIDVGTGTGRDALWFAGEGFDVLGLDYSWASVALARRSAARRGLEASFELFDLADRDAVAAVVAAVGTDAPVAAYARFLVHAVEDAGRAQLFDFARRVGASGGAFYCEFRTGKDADADHVFGEHFRRFLEPALVVDELEALGGTVAHREEGHGLAPYDGEDPHIARLVVRWPT